VTQVAPSASVDDHRPDADALDDRATVFAGIGILVLVIIATIIPVSFATRGAMAANRPIVEVLHFVAPATPASPTASCGIRLGLKAAGSAAVAMLARLLRSIAAGLPAPRRRPVRRLLGTFSRRPAIWCWRCRRWRSWRSPRGPAAHAFATLDDIDQRGN
jgi:cell division transport system permease protein